MKNNLERFIRDNREAFDADESPMDLWARIEPGLDAEPIQKPLNGKPFVNTRTIGNRTGWVFNWWVAASVGLLMLLSGFWFLNHRYGVTEQPEMLAISPSYAREFTQYARLVDQKQAELKDMTASNPALYEAFATDLDRLERSYQTLKADLPVNPNQEVLVQAMIHNLQLQIDLLNEQLRVIQRMKTQNNKSNEHFL